ncbi:MAG TPA: twin-arginine translocase TatA/TatE family subunit [Blastocatellia bacterium]|nr:twin-arginine translocase TatA/TatE family subunit [Blastocatellia bacterium]
MWFLEDLSLPKVLFILAIALLFFGPRRLPELGASLGQAIRGFKQGFDHKESIDANATAATTEKQS